MQGNDIILVTMDVTSLYTNIPNDDGIAASMRALGNNRPGQVKPTNLTIIKMLEVVLKKNNFQFNGNHLLQVAPKLLLVLQLFIWAISKTNTSIHTTNNPNYI